jgi:hypothetical protein
MARRSINAPSRSPYKYKATMQIQVIKDRASSVPSSVDPRSVMARACFKPVVATPSCQRDQSHGFHPDDPRSGSPFSTETGPMPRARKAVCACGRTPSFGSSSLMRWGAGSVTSSQSHCVASITVIFTAGVMRRHGGESSPSILYRSRSSYGRTRGLMDGHPGGASLDLQPQRKNPSKGHPALALI